VVPPEPRRRGVLVPALLLAATAATTWLSGGPAYAAAILAILGAHEMGHYVAARLWKVDTTLPHFIPGPPFAGVGTFGAVIRIRSALPSRRAVLDIGAAGPIAGVLVAVPLLVLGMGLSEVRPLGDLATAVRGNASSPYALIQALLSGEPLLAGGSLQVFGDSLLTSGVQLLVLGPVPPGSDVFLHPVAYAAWLGLFVTTLNLLPIGQLDGGHVIYAWLGAERARRLSGLVSGGLLLCGIFLSWNWLVWWVITRFVVRLSHPPALDEAPLGPGRALLAVLSLLLFAATFIPVPVSM
jgi:membrane-associated protease RseP (regulator of RpoE activity)